MTLEIVHAVFMDRTVTLSESDVVERTGLTATELHALADAGALSVVSTAEGIPRYTIECLTVARTAFRLREQLGARGHACACGRASAHAARGRAAGRDRAASRARATLMPPQVGRMPQRE